MEPQNQMVLGHIEDTRWVEGLAPNEDVVSIFYSQPTVQIFFYSEVVCIFFVLEFVYQSRFSFKGFFLNLRLLINQSDFYLIYILVDWLF